MEDLQNDEGDFDPSLLGFDEDTLVTYENAHVFLQWTYASGRVDSEEKNAAVADALGRALTNWSANGGFTPVAGHILAEAQDGLLPRLPQLRTSLPSAAPSPPVCPPPQPATPPLPPLPPAQPPQPPKTREERAVAAAAAAMRRRLPAVVTCVADLEPVLRQQWPKSTEAVVPVEAWKSAAQTAPRRGVLIVVEGPGAVVSVSADSDIPPEASWTTQLWLETQLHIDSGVDVLEAAKALCAYMSQYIC